MSALTGDPIHRCDLWVRACTLATILDWIRYLILKYSEVNRDLKLVQVLLWELLNLPGSDCLGVEC